MHSLSGVTFDLGVLRKTKLLCKRVGSTVQGEISGLDPKSEHPARVYVVQYAGKGDRLRFGRGVLATVRNGKFVANRLPFDGIGMCLYAGSTTESSAMSKTF
jgi:hypothetical protein